MGYLGPHFFYLTYQQLKHKNDEEMLLTYETYRNKDTFRIHILIIEKYGLFSFTPTITVTSKNSPLPHLHCGEFYFSRS